ncbi:transposase family protein [Streptomyces formicae]|uniref:Transposase family protein n=1 Tax=Streptomyces formicae TaxID=1616117 RepID=A0ABY3WQW3_9ACTN|nr:transposase family protein [Streptomyces formicae]
MVELVTMLIVIHEGARRCKLPPHQRALLALACLRKHETFAQLAAGFHVAVGTTYAFTRAVTGLLACHAPVWPGPCARASRTCCWTRRSPSVSGSATALPRWQG